MQISWNLLYSYPICKPLFTWAGNFLLLVSCLPSSVRCFPGPRSLLSSQENLKSCTHAEPWELFQLHRGCREWCSKWMTQLCGILTPQFPVRHRKGSADPSPLTGYSPPDKEHFNPKGKEDLKWWQGMRQHQRPQSFSGLPLKSWLLWSSPLLQIHRKPDRLFLHLTFKQVLSCCRIDLTSYSSKMTQELNPLLSQQHESLETPRFTHYSSGSSKLLTTWSSAQSPCGRCIS